MKVIGCYNIKGGVGKTATAVNLASLAANEGKRTLIWDLDPQGAATYYFRIKPKVKGGGRGLLRKRCSWDHLVKGTDFEYLDLLPADFSYRNLDLVLEENKKPTKQLGRLLKPLSQEYDCIFLDCPPSISLVSENIFRAADALLVPMIPTTLSARTLDQLQEFLAGHAFNPNMQFMPFFSMVDRRKRLHTDLMAALPKAYPDFLQTSIPYSAEVERMGVYRMPVVLKSPDNPASKAYSALWQEVKTRLYPSPRTGDQG